MTIPFTQYHLPNGRRTQEEFETDSAAIEALAHKVIEEGGRFEAEILTTGEVSVTCAAKLPDPTEPGKTFEGDIAIGLCRNEHGFLKHCFEGVVARAAVRLGIK